MIFSNASAVYRIICISGGWGVCGVVEVHACRFHVVAGRVGAASAGFDGAPVCAAQERALEK